MTVLTVIRIFLTALAVIFGFGAANRLLPDGDGRAARIMMNAELAAGSQERLIIPTAYRIDYLGALKSLSQTGNPAPVIRMLDHAQRYADAIDRNNLASAQIMLGDTGAFMESENAKLKLPAKAVA